MFLRTREWICETAERFSTKSFALNFPVGVATGIPMGFEFGTGWAADSGSVPSPVEPERVMARTDG